MQRGKNVIANHSNRGLLGSSWGVTSDKATHSPLPLSKFLKAVGGYVVFTSHKNQPYSSKKHSSVSSTRGPKCCKDQLERSARKDAKLDRLMLNFSPKHAPVSVHTLRCSIRGRWMRCQPRRLSGSVFLTISAGRATTGLWEGACTRGMLFGALKW